MRWKNPRRRTSRFGLWLGLTALAIQGFFPFLLAGELRAANLSEDLPGFCHLAEATDDQPASGAPSQRHDHVLCPICLGLQATAPFLAADAPSLVPPRLVGLAAEDGVETVLRSTSRALAYRSRAPPFPDRFET